MAIQQLTQPIINPIPAFDSTRAHTISFVVIGGAQVIGNRLVISDNKTGKEIYNKIQSTMKLEHSIPANTLTNGGYYNAVVYTIDSANNESVASTPVPFYCYSQPSLTIDNIPATETIENGTYKFVGSYLQQENELLNSYQYTLYNSNKNVLSQSALIYYDTDSSLSYTFVGMSNDTAYYIELSGETINGTKITSGLKYFTVRYIQPASFAICDLVNNCEDGYIQISSNIVAIDGKSNPDPPIYIDDKEVDLRDPDSWVEWNSGFRIQDDFTMRVWGRDFNDYQNIITLTNDINTTTTPNRIELKWMIGDVIKTLPSYTTVEGKSINILDAEAAKIQNLSVGGNLEQKTEDEIDFGTDKSLTMNTSKIYSLGDIKNLIDVPAFNIKYNQQYFQSTNTNFILKPNFIYTLSFNYNVNATTTDLYYSIGYGTNGYDVDLKSNIQYQSLTKGRNSVSFTVPENIPNNATLWVKFAQTIILADINVDISNIQLESGNISTDYEDPNLYNIYPTSASKNLFNYDSPVYLLRNNATYTPIQNGYNIKPTVINQDAYIGIGIKNVLNSGDIYTISFSQLGQFEKFNLYTTEKGNENIISEIPINNNSFVAPEGVYDLQLVFGVDSSNLSNYIEIWNIQIEANNVISEYEPYVSNSAVISLDEPLRGLGEYRDLICLESPNILNPETQSGIVKGDTTYYLNQAGNTQYYIWYYNEDGNLIKFIDTEGHEASGIVGIKGNFTTHKDCVKITITKSSNPDSQDVTADELKTNQVGITKGDNAQVYYPYVTEPSVIRYIQHRVFDGVNNKFISKHSTIYTDTNGFYQLSLPGKILSNSGDTQYGICNYLKYIHNVAAGAINSVGLWWEGFSNFNYASLPITNLNDANQWLVNLNNAKKPMTIDYVLKTPVVTSLSEDNISALKSLSTYKPISNVFTNNEILGYLKLDYVSDYTEQQTQNAYVLLKCWNANSMPYICHSNYIDIPDEKDKVFIWMRRKNNLFDLKIENLGNYNEDDKPTDKTKPIVTLEINPNNVEATRIPVTAYSIDDNGLKTVRFSKDNGNTWDEIVNVDGLSSTNSYIFINLNPNTTYTIRVEAIDLAGNIGGISQQVTTKSS